MAFVSVQSKHGKHPTHSSLILTCYRDRTESRRPIYSKINNTEIIAAPKKKSLIVKTCTDSITESARNKSEEIASVSAVMEPVKAD